MTTPELKSYNEDEKKFYTWIRGVLKSCHVQRIETTTGPGVPDLNVCHNAQEMWIELKMVIKQGILLRKEQYGWGMKRAIHGGYVYVMALNKDAGIIHVWLYPKIDVSSYNDKYVKIESQPHASFVKKSGSKVLLDLLYLG